MSVKRVKLVVAYDGTNYCGWQVQPNGITIEGVLNRELSKLLKEDIVVIGASRTDSGVHSYGNVAVFDTNARMPAEKISYALNQRLPEDIVVQNSCEVPPDWHPRHCNSRKTYEYRILNREFPMPQRRLDTWFVYRKLNIPAMCEAARRFEGTHDFKSFCTAKTGSGIHSADHLFPGCFQRRGGHDRPQSPGKWIFIQYDPDYCRDPDPGRRRCLSAEACKRNPGGKGSKPGR